jgi:hypothetical protein
VLRNLEAPEGGNDGKGARAVDVVRGYNTPDTLGDYTRLLSTSPLSRRSFVSWIYKVQLTLPMVTGLTYTTRFPMWLMAFEYDSPGSLSTATYSHLWKRSQAWKRVEEESRVTIVRRNGSEIH